MSNSNKGPQNNMGFKTIFAKVDLGGFKKRRHMEAKAVTLNCNIRIAMERPNSTNEQ